MEDLAHTDAVELLESEDVAHLAVFSQGEPYVSPVSYVISDGELLFRTGPGRRLDAIEEHPRVCIEVTSYNRDSGDWRSVIAWGDAVVVSEDLRSAEAVSLLLTKYRRVMGSPLGTSRGMPMAEEVVVAVRLEHISGRSSGSSLAPKTRPGRL